MAPGRSRKLYESDNFLVTTALITLPKNSVAETPRAGPSSKYQVNQKHINDGPIAGPSPKNAGKCKQEHCLYYQNINGLKSKSLEIEMRIDKCYDYDILCFTETKYKNAKEFVGIKDYVVGSYYCRKNANGGGTMIMLKPGMQYKELKDIVKCSIERQCEVACVEIGNLVLLSVYKPPCKDGWGNYAIFENTMTKILNKISGSGKSLMICGDFNEDILVEPKTKNHRLLDYFDEFNLRNVYCEPTRETDTSSRCIDNIFTNCTILEQYIHPEDISDHKGLDVVFKISGIQKHTQQKYTQQKQVPLFKSCCILAKYGFKEDEDFMLHDYDGHSELSMGNIGKGEEPIRWGPKDSDLIIIQQLWDNLKKRVRDYYDPAPDTLAELREVLDEEMKDFSDRKLLELHDELGFETADIYIKFKYRIGGQEQPAEYRIKVLYDPVE